MLERPQHGARGAAPVARGELIDHSVFRRLAQEARTSGQRDGGPVIEPGQTAMHRMRHDRPDWKKDCPRLRNGSIRVPYARFSSPISRRFFETGGSAQLADRTQYTGHLIQITERIRYTKSERGKNIHHS
ncbi:MULTISPECIES: hypothetical protein [Burkholderia cepacia complex]|uniref:hypothetical protein n=1 Tax=Burkholderia cepacia complex TaxID=87882 RepID=UPI002FE1644A